MTDEEKEKVRHIFIQLVRPGEGTEDTRRIAVKGELGEQSWSLVKKLADARLVVTNRNATSQETVEVVHETLIRNWGKLREWMSTDRVFRAWQERLRATIKQWEATNKDRDSLLRGAALAEAEEKIKERPEDLISEKAFIEQSLQERDRQNKERESLRQRIFFGVSAGLVFALALSGFAGWQWRQTEISKSEVMAGYAELLFEQGKDFKALIESLRAGVLVHHVKAKPSRQIINPLQQAVFQVREHNTLARHGSYVTSVSFSSDGQTLASGSGDHTIKLWEIKTGREIYTLRGHGSYVNSVSFSPGGQTLASGSGDGTIKLWDVKTKEELHTQ